MCPDLSNNSSQQWKYYPQWLLVGTNLQNYIESVVGKLGLKECQADSSVNANFRFKDSVDVSISNDKDHPTIKINNE